MDESKKLELLKIMQEEQDETVLSTYLLLAGRKILMYAYGADTEVTEVPDKWATVQLEAAVYLLNKRRMDYQTSHSENGITRTYESADLPASLLANITPYARVHG